MAAREGLTAVGTRRPLAARRGSPRPVVCCGRSRRTFVRRGGSLVAVSSTTWGGEVDDGVLAAVVVVDVVVGFPVVLPSLAVEEVAESVAAADRQGERARPAGRSADHGMVLRGPVVEVADDGNVAFAVGGGPAQGDVS